MRPTRTIWLWTLAALLLSLVSPAAQAAWQCEGRTCGTTLWFCCCAAPEAERDANCAGVTSRQAAGAGMACPAECECTLTVRSLDTERRTGTVVAVTPDFHVTPLLPAVLLLPMLPTEKVARQIESRGPPTSHDGLPAAGLRGPPALTFSAIG